MIRLDSIYKTYTNKNRPPHHALSNVNITINTGSIYGIIGRSGAGKSSLIRLVNLLERPTSGRVIINDQDITDYKGDRLRSLRHKIGMVFQHFNLLSSRTVLENVCFPLRLTGQNKSKRQAKALELLELVGLTEHAQKYPSQLSGGQKQRVGIARALANDPEFLLCDEATSALDPETTKSILNLLLDINRRLGITIILITHSMNVIRSTCDEVAVLDQGVIVEEGNVIDVFLHPQHETTKALLVESDGGDAEAWKSIEVEAGVMVLKLSYRGDVTTRPVISNIAKELDMEISILQGTVSKLKEIAYGQLVVAVKTPVGGFERLVNYLQANQVDYEVLKG